MTYLLLSLPFLGFAIVVAISALRGVSPKSRSRRLAAMGSAGIVVLLLTAVFDSVMIANGLFAYADETRLGVTIWLAPIEDFAYPIVTVLLVPAIWSIMLRRRRLERSKAER